MNSNIVQLSMKSVIEESSYNQEKCTNKSPQINIINTPLNEMSFMTDFQLDSTIIANKVVLKDGPRCLCEKDWILNPQTPSMGTSHRKIYNEYSRYFMLLRIPYDE